jgi:hypothetical protein
VLPLVGCYPEIQINKLLIFTSVVEPKIFLPAPVPAPALDSNIRYLENYLFDLSYRIKSVTIYKNNISTHDFFSLKFLQV